MLNGLLNRLGVLVEQFEWSGGVSIATHIGKGIFDVDLATALPDCIPYCNEGQWKQDDHVERFATRGDEQHNCTESSRRNASNPRGGNLSEDTEVNGLGTTCQSNPNHSTNEGVSGRNRDGQERHREHENGCCSTEFSSKPTGWCDIGDLLSDGFHNAPSPCHHTDGNTG